MDNKTETELRLENLETELALIKAYVLRVSDTTEITFYTSIVCILIMAALGIKFFLF